MPDYILRGTNAVFFAIKTSKLCSHCRCEIWTHSRVARPSHHHLICLIPFDKLEQSDGFEVVVPKFWVLMKRLWTLASGFRLVVYYTICRQILYIYLCHGMGTHNMYDLALDNTLFNRQKNLLEFTNKASDDWQISSAYYDGRSCEG